MSLYDDMIWSIARLFLEMSALLSWMAPWRARLAADEVECGLGRVAGNERVDGRSSVVSSSISVPSLEELVVDGEAIVAYTEFHMSITSRFISVNST